MRPRTLRWAIATVVTGGLLGLIIAAHQVLLVTFVGILLGILFDGIAEAFHRISGWPKRRCALLLLLFGCGALTGSAIHFGPTAIAGLEEAAQRAPALIQQAVARLERYPLGALLLDSLPDLDTWWTNLGLETVTTTVAGLGRGLAGVGLAGFIAVTVGLDPGRVGRWLLALWPSSSRARAQEVGAAAHRALQFWLVGRLADMTALMILTGLGLWWLGLPFAPGLAIIAGFLEFIPYLGPVLSVFPALVVALGTPRPDAVLHVLILYAGLQILQSYVITPLIEQRAVRVPPALGLTTQAALGLLAGPIGVVVATPLVVILIVLVQTLYIQDRLHESVRVLGDSEASQPPDPAPG